MASITAEELIEFYPEGKPQIVTVQDLIVYTWLCKFAQIGKLYTIQELFYMIKPYADQDLVKSKLKKLNLYGHKHYSVMTIIMNNLWWADKARKFGVGVYRRSGRPYKVYWMIEQS